MCALCGQFQRTLPPLEMPRLRRPGVPSYCPTCRGLMRPERGALVCIACTARAKARTVLSGGRRIALASGQQGLSVGTRTALLPAGVDPVLEPQKPGWTPKPPADGVAPKPHPRLGLFPYDEIRDGQVRFTRDVKLAVMAGKHVVAHAPTGIGKTAASLAPALEAALESKKVVMFLTNRQSQHRIAVETLRRIQENRGVAFTLVDLVSKRDMCLRPEAAEMHPNRFPEFCGRETRNKSCSFIRDVDANTLRRVRQGVLHVEELMGVSKGAHLCPHLVAMAAAREAQVVIADYNHLFSDIRTASLERLGVTLPNVILLVDEAHNLPERIKSNHSHRVNPFLLDAAEAEARSHNMPLVMEDIASLRGALTRLADAKSEAGLARPAKLGGDATRVATLGIEELQVAWETSRNRLHLATQRAWGTFQDDLQKLVRTVRKEGDGRIYAEELAGAVEDWGRFASGALRYLEWADGGVQLHIRLLDPAVPAREVFDKVHSAVLMSGTLRPPEMARDLLGLAVPRTVTRVYPSPFDPANRPVVVAQGVSTRYEARGEALWARLGALVQQVAGATRGNIAVFTPSYAILRELRSVLPETGKEFVVEDSEWGKAERDRVLDTLEGARRRGSGAILLGVLGGSLAEGVDFANNLLSCVIVVGVPLAPPDLEVEATIAYFERSHPGQGRNYGYTVPAMNRVLQAMGRGVRGPKDKCAVILWDERYLMQPYRGLLPDDAVVTASFDPASIVTPFLAAAPA